jgi:hypothetical protein
MKVSNEELFELLNEIKSMIQCLMKSSKSKKFNILMDEVKLRKRMDVGSVQSFLGGISRPWTLNLMKKLGKENHFDFIKGDVAMKRPSLIIYNEAQAVNERYEKIKELMSNLNIASFAQISQYLNLNLERDLILLKRIIDNFVEKEKSYFIKDGNKLCKKLLIK